MSDRISFELDIDQVRSRVSVIAERGTLASGIKGVSTLDDAETGDITFISSPKYADKLESCAASVIFVPKGFEREPREGQHFIEVANPSLALAKICELAEDDLGGTPVLGVHPSASIHSSVQVPASVSLGPNCVIEEGVELGEGCVIDANTFIGRNSKIGEGSMIFPRVSIMSETVLGTRCRIHSGVVLGADGFGYEFSDGRHQKVPQLGNVVVGDDVEIGANTAIDRGRFGPTEIGSGTKIDNHVQVGHNVKIGQHCILCAQVGIAGSTVIEDYAVFGGRAGASMHLRIGKGAQVAGCSAAFTDLEPGGKYGGTPAIPLATHQRITVLIKKLPDLLKRLRRLESKLDKSEQI